MDQPIFWERLGQEVILLWFYRGNITSLTQLNLELVVQMILQFLILLEQKSINTSSKSLVIQVVITLILFKRDVEKQTGRFFSSKPTAQPILLER